MPTIAEIIAAKKAKQQPAAVTTAAPRESIAERVELVEVINRIDPPGKSERATAARKSAGLILSKEMPACNDNRVEVPREVTQPSNDQQMCVVIEDQTVWLCMPCEDPATPPIKVLRLPLTVWPYPAPEPLPEGDPF